MLANCRSYLRIQRTFYLSTYPIAALLKSSFLTPLRSFFENEQEATRWRPSLLGWRPFLLEAIAIRLEAIPTGGHRYLVGGHFY